MTTTLQEFQMKQKREGKNSFMRFKMKCSDKTLKNLKSQAAKKKKKNQRRVKKAIVKNVLQSGRCQEWKA